MGRAGRYGCAVGRALIVCSFPVPTGRVGRETHKRLVPCGFRGCLGRRGALERLGGLSTTFHFTRSHTGTLAHTGSCTLSFLVSLTASSGSLYTLSVTGLGLSCPVSRRPRSLCHTPAAHWFPIPMVGSDRTRRRASLSLVQRCTSPSRVRLPASRAGLPRVGSCDLPRFPSPSRLPAASLLFLTSSKAARAPVRAGGSTPR